MKKIKLLIVFLITILILVGCGNKEPEDEILFEENEKIIKLNEDMSYEEMEYYYLYLDL